MDVTKIVLCVILKGSASHNVCSNQMVTWVYCISNGGTENQDSPGGVLVLCFPITDNRISSNQLFMLLMRTAIGQVMMEELRSYNIDPLDFNGTEFYTELTIDQIIMQASGGSGMAQNLVLGDDDTVLAELDMRLTQEQFFNLYEAPQNSEPGPVRGRRGIKNRRRNSRKNGRRNKRKAIRDIILRWPEAIVPYTFASGHFQQQEEYLMRTAMTEWEKYTCLRFRPATTSDRNMVRFQNGLGCNSQLGMVGGVQPLNLDKNGCRYKGLYLHEIGHAVGLVHEHQLPDRDNYIEILYENVQPNMRIWFNKYSNQEVHQMSVPYEYSSVMHYGITAFSSDGKSQTIRAKEPQKEKSIGRVYRKELSFTDVKIVNLMYNCADHCSDSIICNNGGYVDQNCNCICPDGTDSCTKSSDRQLDPSCYNANENWQCTVWANQGECERNPRFMLESCKKACNLCGNQEEDTGAHITLWTWQWLCSFANICPKNWTIGACEDKYNSSKCQTWKEYGECITNKEWMHKHCKRTCKACDESKEDPEVNCSNNHGNDTQCNKWASEGECQINPLWMPENCRKACHMCDKTSVQPTTTVTPDTDNGGACEDIHNEVECMGWANSGECEYNPDWMIPNCRKSCKKCGGGGGDDGKQECKNIWDDTKCEGWARDQECMKNSQWMNNHCHKACTRCTPDGESSTRPTVTFRPTTTSPSGCKNNHKNDKECETWAKYGHCKINKWMTTHCAKSCKSCTETEESRPTTKKPDTPDTSCVDQKTHCQAWAEHGFCEDNPKVASVMCKKSCRFCSSGVGCSDKHMLCPVWSKGDQCNRNSGYMLRNCRKSCKIC